MEQPEASLSLDVAIHSFKAELAQDAKGYFIRVKFMMGQMPGETEHRGLAQEDGTPFGPWDLQKICDRVNAQLAEKTE